MFCRSSTASSEGEGRRGEEERRGEERVERRGEREGEEGREERRKGKEGVRGWVGVGRE